MSRQLVTAALPYANGPIHIGHLAGCYLPADIYVRFQRLNNKDILFLCGSDEHGVPITIKARNEGVTPQQVVDKYHNMMKNAFVDFGITFDHYARTSSPLHHQTASDFFKSLYDKNVFVEEVTQQYYDEEVNQFLADRYIVGTCPTCANPNAYGDQCENCGTSLNPTDLIDPKSKLSGKAPVLRETKNWFLPLDTYQQKLTTWISSHAADWRPTVYGQCFSWLNQGLQKRAMTRDLDWGVKVPLPNTDGKVLYVWFDAPIGYISATKELMALRNTPDEWKNYWQNSDTQLLHFIGKDNIVFHCLIFPAMLMAHEQFILPKNVPANEFLNLEGQKISTSRNWAVWLHEYLIDFKNKQDELRYVLCAIAPETKDADFSWKDFQARVNNELVAILGNFINRTLVLTHKFFEGVIPQSHVLLDVDTHALKTISNTYESVTKNINDFKFRDALADVMNLARTGNKYLADTEPWKLFKTDSQRVGTILNTALEITTHLATLCQPFLPNTSKKIFEMIGISPLPIATHNANVIKAGHQLNQPQLLFEKIEDEAIQAQIDKLHTAPLTSIENKFKPAKTETTFDDFMKMDLRIATITAAVAVPKTEKLLQLTLDTGIDIRTVVSGIALHHKPENIIGKQVVLLANLAPRKIKGIESKGMILMAEDADGSLKFVSTDVIAKNGSAIS
jgi:methionyl-tRNA synthetase